MTLDLDMTYGKLYKMVEVDRAWTPPRSCRSRSLIPMQSVQARSPRPSADIVPDVLVEKVGAGSCKTVSDVSYQPQQGVPPD